MQFTHFLSGPLMLGDGPKLPIARYIPNLKTSCKPFDKTLRYMRAMQFVSRPFVVGDRVELRTATGASVVLGLVERISPMNTTFRSDQNIPISIPNKSAS